MMHRPFFLWRSSGRSFSSFEGPGFFEDPEAVGVEPLEVYLELEDFAREVDVAEDVP